MLIHNTMDTQENYLMSSLALFLIISGFILPSGTTGLIVGIYYGTMTANITIIVTALLQMLLAAIGGFLFMHQLTEHTGYVDCRCWCSYHDEEISRHCMRIYGINLTSISTLFKGSYLLYVLSIWFITNLFCVLFNRPVGLPTAMEVLCYFPPFTLMVGTLVGYFTRTLRDEYDPV